MSERDSPEVQLDYTLVVLLKEIYAQLDELALLKKRGRKANISAELLREMCSVLQELEPSQKERYFDLLVRTSTDLRANPPAEPSEDFIEASSRPRRRAIEKARIALGLKAA